MAALISSIPTASPVDARIMSPIPADLVLTPISRRPIRLPEATLAAIEAMPIPTGAPAEEAPAASIIVVTWNNLPFTKLCLTSLLSHPAGLPFEVIVVENASTDGTPAFLREVAARNANVRLIFNDTNRGFAAANNQGLGVARGRMLVLLNNDTMVPPGWLARFDLHLADPTIGLLGPVTNRIGNEAEIETSYARVGEFLAESAQRSDRLFGVEFDLPRPAMFCLALRHNVFLKLGSLDEQFGLGFFEDDDYAMRARAAGLRTVGAEDVLIHHFGEASFGAPKLPRGTREDLFRDNRWRFEQKWAVHWNVPARRDSASYYKCRTSLLDMVRTLTPAGSRVLVVSRGDDALLRIPERYAEHFPQESDGTYAGCYPADDAELVRRLAELAARGLQYLAMPATSIWWLEHYPALSEWLGSPIGVASPGQGDGLVFRLPAARACVAAPAESVREGGNL